MNLSKYYSIGRLALLLFLVSLIIRVILQSVIGILSYDEIAYAHAAANLVENGGWFTLVNVKDAFFFPPLFIYLSALLYSLGLSELMAVRVVSIVFSSAIAPLMLLSLSNASHRTSSALIAVVLWSIIPYALLMSVLGHVEMTMIFFVVLSFYLLTLTKIQPLFATVLSAVTLALALWVKETALAFVPIFLYLVWKRKQSMTGWIIAWILVACPLWISLATNSEYTLFSEINPSRVALGAPASDSFINAFGRLVGASSKQLIGYRLTLTAFLLGVLVVSLFSIKLERIRQSAALQFGLGILLVFLPFLLIYSRKNPYYQLPFFLSATVFMGEYLKDKRRLCVVVLTVLSALSILQFRNWAKRDAVYDLHTEMLKQVAMQKKNARIATGTPRLAEYIVKQNRLPLVIEELPLSTSPKLSRQRAYRSQETILQSDYYLGNEFFLKMVFCGKWSRKNRCLQPHYLSTRPFLQPESRVGPTKLYRVLDRSELKEKLASRNKRSASLHNFKGTDNDEQTWHLKQSELAE